MKEIEELNLPDDIRYSKDHEWARQEEGGVVRIGIDDYAQDQLGEVVFVELPQIGDSFQAGAEFGTVESVKAVAELYMPVGGEVVAVNDALADAPELVNASPYGEGWMVLIKPDNPADWDALMSRADYLGQLSVEE